MNFLSHYYGSPKKSPYFVVGTVLPDLVRMYDRAERVRSLQFPKLGGRESTQKKLNEGVNWHIAVDKWFHQTPFFKKNVQHIKQLLKEQSFAQYPRFLYFVAHILLELLLDRILVKMNKEVGHRFYEQLNKAKQQPIALYLNAQKNVQQVAGFLQYFDRFIKNRYVFDYAHNENFIFALNRVVTHTGNNGFLEADFPLLEDCIEQIEKNLVTKTKVHELFNQLSKEIPAPVK